VYALAEPEHERVALPFVVVVVNATLVGFNVHTRPVDGETMEVSVIVPVKPSEPVTIMVELPVPPAKTIMFVGDAATPKS
jgi:hypothetical protein